MDEENYRQQAIESMRKKYEEDEKRRNAEMQLDILLAKLMDSRAKERLSNVKLVNRELYISAASYFVRLANSGQLKGRVSEEQVIEVLTKLKKPERSFTIRRK